MAQAQAQAQVVGSTVDGQAQGRVAGAARRLGSEVAKFGTVGAVAFVIDVGLFNILRAGVLSDSPLTAKTISVIVATDVRLRGQPELDLPRPRADRLRPGDRAVLRDQRRRPAHLVGAAWPSRTTCSAWTASSPTTSAAT